MDKHWSTILYMLSHSLQAVYKINFIPSEKYFEIYSEKIPPRVPM